MRRLALQVLLVIFVITAGCSQPGQDHAREERAVRALDNATDALSLVDSYRFESDMSITATADSSTRQVDVDLTGGVNVMERQMRSNATRNGELQRTFVLNRTVYRECGHPWDGWAVEKLDDDSEWANRTPAIRQLSLLESGSLYWNGTTTLDGEQANLLTGEPTIDAITEYRDEQTQPLFDGPSINDAELRIWVDADTGRPLQTVLQFTVSKDDNTATATMTTDFSNYNESVSIELPTEARTNQYELSCPGE